VTLVGGSDGAEAFFSQEANPANSSPVRQASKRFIDRFVFGNSRVVNDLNTVFACRRNLRPIPAALGRCESSADVFRPSTEGCGNGRRRLAHKPVLGLSAGAEALHAGEAPAATLSLQSFRGMLLFFRE
jgi:hypothetical protein